MANTNNNQIMKDGFNMENAVEIKISDSFTVRVDPYPTIQEKIAFVKTVVDGSYINDEFGNEEIYYSLVDANFTVLFLTAFSDYIFPYELKNEDGTMNIDSAYNSIRHLDWYKLRKNPSVGALMKNLDIDVNKQIEFRNQKIVALHSRNIVLEETLDNLNSLITKGMDFISGTIDTANSFTPETFSDIVKNIPEQFLTLVGDNSSKAVE